MGVTFTVTITSLNDTLHSPPQAYTQITYQGYTLAESMRIGLMPPFIPWETSFLFKTTDNQTYWEEWCTENTDTQYPDDSHSYWVEGEQLHRQSFHRYGEPFTDDTSNELWVYNWKTGWLVSYYYSYTDAAGSLLVESEFRDVSVITAAATSSDSRTPGLDVLSLLSVMLVATVIVYRRRLRAHCCKDSHS